MQTQTGFVMYNCPQEENGITQGFCLVRFIEMETTTENKVNDMKKTTPI